MLRQAGNYAKMLLTLWRIHSKVPEAKIILTIREQRDWLLSRYKHGIGTGYLTLTFEEWLFSGQGIDFLSLGHYGMIYQALSTYFPQENVFILPYEILRDNYNKFFCQLYDIIKLDPAIPGKIIHKNASLPEDQLACKRYLNRFALFPKTASARSGTLHKIQSRVIKKSSEILLKVGGRSRFSKSKINWPNTNAFDSLLSDFARSNQELKNLSSLPIDKYGYCIKN
jgi:hypothetical protein